MSLDLNDFLKIKAHAETLAQTFVAVVVVGFCYALRKVSKSLYLLDVQDSPVLTQIVLPLFTIQYRT